MLTREQIKDFICENAPDECEVIPLFDDPDEAIVGIARGDDMVAKIVYDEDEIISILMIRDGMSYEDASEFYDFNIAGTKFGNTEILYLNRLPKR